MKRTVEVDILSLIAVAEASSLETDKSNSDAGKLILYSFILFIDHEMECKVGI